MSLDFTGVWKGFAAKTGPHYVLRDVNLSIEPGQFVSFIGHSGCGKSTLLNMAAGLLAPDAGTISLDGTPVTSPGPDRAVVFQNYSLLPRTDLLDNVRIAVRAVHPEWSKAHVDGGAERYLTAVGLWEHKHKKPHQVSGGMMQRCAVARAFAVEPRVLLLDEPFGALDALTRSKLQAQLIDLWKSESDTEIVVMVTHGIDEATFLSDRIVVMANPPSPSIIETIEVGVVRPRDLATFHDGERAHAVEEHLMNVLRSHTVSEESAA